MAAVLQEAALAGGFGERVVSYRLLPFPVGPVREESANKSLSRQRQTNHVFELVSIVARLDLAFVLVRRP
jgi:hypothetical protein